MGGLDKQGVMLVAAWGVLLAVILAAGGYYATLEVAADKRAARVNHLARLASGAVEKGHTRLDEQQLQEDPQQPAEKVKVGIYVDHVVSMSTKETSWTVDFYVWFSWRDQSLRPGETFQVVDADILSRRLMASHRQGGETYELYRVVARITKFFNVARFPRDDHLLTIRIEDTASPWQQLRYLPEENGSDLSSRVSLPGYKVYDTFLLSKPHPYRTNRGDPRLRNQHQAVYDQLIYGIGIKRPGWGLYFKMFQMLFASVAIALLAFLLEPTGGERVGLGVGAFFAAVASSYVISGQLPGVGVLTLSDMVNLGGMVTIFLSVLGSIMVSRLAGNPAHRPLAILFDRVSLLVLAVGYLAANVVVALTASL